jgi:uncharacterized membrane protein YdjX (TVP38/TMEM64 family)
MEAPSVPAPAERSGLVRRLLPLLVLVALIALAYGLGVHDYLSFDALRENRTDLLAFVERRSILAPLAYMLIYAAVIALSLPGGAVLTLAGGFMFGTVLATGLVVVGATLGACIVFLIAKTALGEPLRARAGPWLRRMEEGFAANALSYMLVLRLIPLFPFWLVNLVPAFAGVPLGTYAVATFVGIIPGSCVYASVGAGLGAVFDQGGTPDLRIILQPRIFLPLVGLALLALLPVAYKRWKARKAGAGQA